MGGVEGVNGEVLRDDGSGWTGQLGDVFLAPPDRVTAVSPLISFSQATPLCQGLNLQNTLRPSLRLMYSLLIYR